jgi:DNA repair ATPase RecN
MRAEEKTNSGPFNMVLGPLRFPERLAKALERAAEALEHVEPMHDEVVYIRKQSETLSELRPAIDDLKNDFGERLEKLDERMLALERIEQHLDETVDGLVDEIRALHGRIADLQDDVQRVTDRLPDAEAPGPLERARDAIAGG